MAEDYVRYVKQIEQVRWQVEQSQTLIRNARDLIQRSWENQLRLDKLFSHRPRSPGPAAETLPPAWAE